MSNVGTMLLAERQPDVFILDMEAEQDPIGTMRQMRVGAEQQDRAAERVR